MGVASARARNEVPRLRVRSSRAGGGRKGHWSARFQDVTEAVIAGLSAAYRENAPEFIYFLTLYNIFHEFLEDVSEDELPNEATGFRESQVWQMLYNFQRDAMLAIVGKLEKFNGCILADSVGLGKTLTALAVVKYYESRNKTVLVLCRRFNAETDDGWRRSRRCSARRWSRLSRSRPRATSTTSSRRAAPRRCWARCRGWTTSN